jgi:hypothetical protein
MNHFKKYLKLINETEDLTINNHEMTYEELCNLVEENKSKYITELTSDKFKFSIEEVKNILLLFNKNNSIPIKDDIILNKVLNYFNKKRDQVLSIYQEAILPLYKIIIINDLEKEKILEIFSEDVKRKIINKIKSINDFSSTIFVIHRKCKEMNNALEEIYKED